jgi:hypothetical protein
MIIEVKCWALINVNTGKVYKFFIHFHEMRNAALRLLKDPERDQKRIVICVTSFDLMEEYYKKPRRAIFPASSGMSLGQGDYSVRARKSNPAPSAELLTQ